MILNPKKIALDFLMGLLVLFAGIAIIGLFLVTFQVKGMTPAGGMMTLIGVPFALGSAYFGSLVAKDLDSSRPTL